MDAAETGVPTTQPRLTKDTRALAKVAKTQTTADLKRLMHISDNLADLNFERFKAFNLDNKSNSAKPAGLAFDGDVYWGLEAKSLPDETLEYAQDHLRILSGLYGVLRPMDAIQPYRLEMGTKLETPRGKSLYDFWGAGIADQLNADLDGHSDQTIMNLASNEYFKAVDKKALGRTGYRCEVSQRERRGGPRADVLRKTCTRVDGPLDHGKSCRPRQRPERLQC